MQPEPAPAPQPGGPSANESPGPVVSPNPSQAPPWLDRGHIPALDGLRAVAVGLVVFSHAHMTAGFPVRLPGEIVERVGILGVDVFFVLSGFLITTLLCRELDRSGRVSLRGFYLRRALRILPAYLALLAAVGVMQARGLVAVPAHDWVAAATYTVNFLEHPVWEFGHVWSLSIEEHFYLLWPPVFVLASRRTALWVLLAVLVAGPAIRWALLLHAPELAPVTELWTFVRLDSIAFGCLIALLARGERGRRILNWVGQLWPVALALLAITVGLTLVSGKFSVGVAPSLIAATVTVLVWTAARRKPKWLEHPAVATIGVVSYGLYIWQELFLNPRRDEWWTAFPQNLILTALVTLLSYRLIERPFLRLKDRLASARPAPQTASLDPEGAPQLAPLGVSVPVPVTSSRAVSA